MTENDPKTLSDESEALAARLDRMNEPDAWLALDRGDRELLGLLAGALEPRPASAELRRRILAAAAPGEEAQPAPLAALTPPVGALGPSEDDDPGPAAADRRSRGSWMLPLAATLALALFGLSGWQYFQLERQQAVIDRLATNLGLALERSELVGDLEVGLLESRAKLAMMTEPGVEYCLLKPQAEEYELAHATMVVSAARDGWYLRVEGLEPCAEGRTYRVWWHTAEGPVPAGSFDASADGTIVELSAAEVPAEVRGVSITLEPDPKAPEPRGERVLFADEAMRLL